MRSWIRRAILALATATALAVLAAVVAVFAIVPRPGFQQWLGGRLSAALGPGIDFRAVSLAFWPELGVRLHGVRLAEASRGATDGVTTIESVSCALLPGALLGGEIVVDHITLEEPVLSVERSSDGRWSVGDSLQRLLSRAAAAGSADPAAGPESDPRPIPRLLLRDGIVDLADARVRGGPVTLHMRNLDADLALPRPGSPGRLRISMAGPARAHLEVDATFEPMRRGESIADVAFRADVRGRSLASDSALLYLLRGLPIRNPGGVFDIEGWVSGRLADAVGGRAAIELPNGFVEGWGIRLATPVRMEASYEVKRGAFSMQGARLEATGAAFADYAAARTEAVFDWAAGDLQVEALDFDAYGGAWTAKGSVSFADARAFASEVRAEEVAFHRLATALAGDDVDESFETFSGEASLRGVWTGPDTWQDTLTGFGRVHLSGGRIESSSVMRSFFQAVFAKIPGVSDLQARKGSAEPTQLERLNASFAVRGARAFTKDLDLLTSAYRMQGEGSVGFDGSLELSTRVALTARGIESAYKLASIPNRERGDRSLPAVPFRVYGTLAEPEVVPDLTGIPLTPFRLLFGGAQGAIGLVRGAAAPEGVLRGGLEKVLSPAGRADGKAREREPGAASPGEPAGP